MKSLVSLLLFFLFTPYLSAQISNDLGYEIGTSWVYEAEQPMSLGMVYPVTIRIVDTATVNDTLAFYLESETIYSSNSLFLDHARYMHVEGPRVYFYNDELERFVMNYDYSNPSAYSVPWTGVAFLGGDIAEVVIDEVTAIDVPSGQSINVQQATVSNSGSYEEAFETEIFTGIGSNDYFRLYLGHGLSDGDFITKLRCFSPGNGNDDAVSFVSYPCDSSWIRPIVNTREQVPTLDLSISPNPSAGKLQIVGLQTGSVYDYQLLDLSGRVITAGRQAETELSLDANSGTYLLRIESAEGVYTQRLIIATLKP